MRLRRFFIALIYAKLLLSVFSSMYESLEDCEVSLLTSDRKDDADDIVSADPSSSLRSFKEDLLTYCNKIFWTLGSLF